MTDKTLKHFFEVYKPKAPDEQKFVDKHVTIKHKDRNGNGDDVFNATNIKTIDRKKENHGYNSGEDEKVYEEVEDLDELSRDTLRRYRMKSKAIGDNEKGDIGYRSKGRDLAARKTHGGQWGIPKAKVMAKEEAEQVDEIAPLIAAGAELAAGAAGRALATRAATSLGASAAERMVAGQAGKFAGKALASKAASSLTSKSSGGKDVREEVEQLEEGTMKLSKVHIVHHHDHPAAKEFAKHYTEGMKGEHREGGPSEKDEAASNRFHERYSGMTTRHGFAGSGTTIYHDHKTGAKWKVDRHPNGKTFYGTDHIISHHIPSVNESVEEEILSTEAEDRVIRSLVAYYEELGEEVLINDIVDIAEQMLDELSVKTLDSYRTKARKELIDADANDDNRHYNKRAKGYRAASKSVNKKLKEEVELEEGENKTGLPKSTAEKNKQYIEITYLLGHKKKVPVHPTNAYKALNHYRNHPSTKSARIVSEDAEQIDELSTATLQSYRKKARAQGNAIVDKMKVGGGDWSKDQKDTKTLRKRAAGAQMSGKTLRKRGESLKTEEVEQIDELSKKTLGSYAQKAKDQMSRSDTVAGREMGARSAGAKPSARERQHNARADKRYRGLGMAINKLTKEDVINRAVDKYSPSEEERLSLDEQLVARIEDMKESHIHLILNLFEQLDESNQRNLLDMIDQGRVNEVLDFAISAVRGE